MGLISFFYYAEKVNIGKTRFFQREIDNNL